MAVQYKEVNKWKEPFIEINQHLLASICTRLHQTSNLLTKAWVEFPDKNWRSLVTDFINKLFAGFYSYHWYVAGQIEVNSKYIAVLSKELTDFSFKMQDQVGYLKLSLLGEATNKVNNVLQLIQSQAGIYQIPLVEHHPQLILKNSQVTPVSLFYLRGLQTLSDDKSSEYTSEGYDL
jgi:hypothetical protein